MAEESAHTLSKDFKKIKPFTIQGRLERERERCIGMTEAERKMRMQWVRDQVLAPHEPVYVPEIEKELRNPIRRFYRKPLDVLFKALEPTIGHQPTLRYMTGKFILGMFGVFAGIYYFKYNKNDWTRTGGWRVTEGRMKCLPGDPGYPFVSTMTPQDYNSRGFDKSPI